MRERLKDLPDNSVDSVVCDPPYHLTSIVKRFGKADSAPIKNEDEAQGRNGPYHRTAKGFMGQTWDGGDVAFRSETWAEVLRVLKPGGHLVAFSGTRTYHRMAVAVEDAGFEVRDMIAWHYASGFPKSHDISKAIARPDILRVTSFVADAADAKGVGRAAIDAHMGTSDMAGWWTSRLLHRCQCPKWDQWLQLKLFLGFGDEMDAEVWLLNGRKGQPGEAWDQREVIGRATDGAANGSVVGLGSKPVMAQEYDITAPATDAAREWEGWGTALKPATEPICLARKPLSEKSIAANVLKWGTGALNIDGCRIGPLNAGRWPANLCHDGSDEVVAGFPESDSKSGGGSTSTGYWGNAGGCEGLIRDDNGSAARFFYCAKATTDERGEGNSHPTVKPVALMRWLCRLVTPKGGTVLDPFMGSGSTGLACDAEQFDFIGCELSPEYAEIARKRIADQDGMFADVSVEHTGPATRAA